MKTELTKKSMSELPEFYRKILLKARLFEHYILKEEEYLGLFDSIRIDNDLYLKDGYDWSDDYAKTDIKVFQMAHAVIMENNLLKNRHGYTGKFMNTIKIKNELVQWIKDWFEENGKGCTAVLGLSGGKDSTICAALLAEALGPENVIGVAMPDMLQSLNDADKIAEHLGIRFMTAPIGGIVNGFNNMWTNFGDEDFRWSNQAQQNLPPRIRMTMLYAVAQTFNGRVCCCDNASENYLGYSTLFGDDAGSFAPLGNLTVTEIRAIGDLMGLPHEWVHKTPDDGLPHSSSDEQKFGFSYHILDRYIRFGLEPTPEIKEKIDRMHRNSQFKRDIIHVPAYNPYLPDRGVEEEVIELEF